MFVLRCVIFNSVVFSKEVFEVVFYLNVFWCYVIEGGKFGII